MKKGKLCLLFFLGLVLHTGCSNDDDNSNQTEEPINGVWNLMNVSGGLAGASGGHDTGIITWKFNNQTLIVKNNATLGNYSGFESGAYSYLLLEDGNEQFINLNESGDYLKIIIENDEMEIVPEDSRWLVNGEIIPVAISDSYTFKFER